MFFMTVFRTELTQVFSDRSSDATLVYKGASETSYTGPRVNNSAPPPRHEDLDSGL